jgi:hypothetical protein
MVAAPLTAGSALEAPHHFNGEDDMKTLGAILAVLGIIAVAVGALRHFSPFILPTTPNASLYIVAGGIAVMVLGAVVARLGGES